MNNMPAMTGWTWLKEGAGLFRKQPAALTTLLFANILVSLLIGFVPLVGPMLAVVLIPSFSMAFMKACLMIENGERVTPVVALTGFRQPVFAQLCKVGLIYLVVSLLLNLIARFAIDPAFFQQFPGGEASRMPEVTGSTMLTLFLVSALNMSVLIALSFAAPLVYWQQMGAGKAAFYSFFAVWKSARVFVVLLMAWFAFLFALCIVFTLLLGGSNVARVAIMWLIFLFILLLQCSLYAAYRRIFGKPVEAGAATVSLEK